MATLRKLNEDLYTATERMMHLLTGDEDQVLIDDRLGSYFDAIGAAWEASQEVHSILPAGDPIWETDE